MLALTSSRRSRRPRLARGNGLQENPLHIGLGSYPASSVMLVVVINIAVMISARTMPMKIMIADLPVHHCAAVRVQHLA